MKSKKTLLAVVIAASTILSSGLKSAPVIDVNGFSMAGNVFLGIEDRNGKQFTAVGGNQYSLLIDLGPLATTYSAMWGNSYTNSSNGLVGYSLDLSADLSSTFGAGWAGNTNLYWGLVGIDNQALDAANRFSLVSGVSSPAVPTISGLNDIDARYGNIYTAWNNNSGVLTQGVKDDGTATGSWSWGGGSVGAPSTVGPSGNNAFGGGWTIESRLGSAQTLWFMNSSSASSQALGVGNISTSGVFTVVPEPKTYALIGFGALLLIVAYRRKTNA